RSVIFSSRRRHTRLPRDWSSDVCSSDLGASLGGAVTAIKQAQADINQPLGMVTSFQGAALAFQSSLSNQLFLILAAIITVYIVQIGRATCRGQSGYLGVRRSMMLTHIS